jgi:hypothetical protein
MFNADTQPDHAIGHTRALPLFSGELAPGLMVEFPTIGKLKSDVDGCMIQQRGERVRRLPIRGV